MRGNLIEVSDKAIKCHCNDIVLVGLPCILRKNDWACDHFVILNYFFRYKISFL